MSSHEDKQERQQGEENEAEPAPLEGPVDPTTETDHASKSYRSFRDGPSVSARPRFKSLERRDP